MICHKHKTVFIHIPKTAGTSVEAMFGFVKIKNQNFFKEMGVEGKHWNAKQIKEKYAGYFDEYFKWTIVRDPWEREVSLYNMMKNQRRCRGMDFKTFLNEITIPAIENGKRKVFDDQIKYFTIDDNIYVDKIVRYEHLEKGWSQVCKQINKPVKKLEHLRYLGKTPFTEMYDEETLEIVHKLRKADIEFLKYDMPQI